MKSRFYCRIVLLAFVMSFLMSVGAAAQETSSPHWNYSGPNDPKHWGKLDPAYSACAMGHTESPINIAHAELADLP